MKKKATTDPIDKAKRAIAREDIRCFDVADGVGQMFHNVKHMRWFIEAVARECYGFHG